MKNEKPSRRRRSPSPVCVRLTPEEHWLLEASAREQRHASISAYIRSRLFGMETVDVGGATPYDQTRLSVRDRQRSLSQILGRLGASQAFRNLSDLADAARIGVLLTLPPISIQF